MPREGRRTAAAASVINAPRGFALLLFTLGAAYLVEATKLPTWSEVTVGAGMFPLLLGITLLVVSGVWLVLDVVQPRADTAVGDAFLPSRSALARQAMVLGALAVYVVALQPLGFVISTFLFVAALSIGLEPSRRISAVVVAIVLVVLAQVGLVYLLRMPLPTGPIG